MADIPTTMNGVSGGAGTGAVSVKTALQGAGTSAKDMLRAKLLGSLNPKPQETFTDASMRLQKEKGIPQLEQTVQDYDTEVSKTMDLLKNLESDISQRTGQYIVPEAQRRRIVASEKAPITGMLSTLQTGEKQAATRLTGAKSDIEKELGLMEKQRTSEERASSGETASLEKLAKMEEPAKVGTRTVNIGGRQILINSETGARIRDLGPAGKAGTGAKGNTLTLTEAVNRGMPPEMVGMSEADAARDLTSSNAPSWFRTKLESGAKQSIPRNILNSKWEEFRGQFVDEKGNLIKKTKTSSASIQNPFGQ